MKIKSCLPRYSVIQKERKEKIGKYTEIHINEDTVLQ